MRIIWGREYHPTIGDILAPKVVPKTFLSTNELILPFSRRFRDTKNKLPAFLSRFISRIYGHAEWL